LEGVIFLFYIDKQSRTPVYEQIIEQLERLILVGSVKPNELIPSVRSLSMELSINPNTIQKAYNYFENKQITYSVPGVGRFVSEKAKDILSSGNNEKLVIVKDILYELALSDIHKEMILDIVEDAYLEAEKNKEKRD
jgi:GntR family transcriptional regulator